MAREFAGHISRTKAQPDGAIKLAFIKMLLNNPELKPWWTPREASAIPHEETRHE
jgi:hypothetical protein